MLQKELLLVLLILGFQTLSRFILLKRNTWLGVDSFYHLIVARYIRKKKKLPETIDSFIFKEDYNYPPLLHFILSLFNEKYDQKLQYMTPIFDIITGLVIFGCFYYLFNYSVALLSLIIYILTPITLDNSISLSPRGMANTFFVGSLFSLLLYLISYNLIFLLLAIFLASLVYITHRLTTQALWFVLISLTIFLQSLYPLLVLFLALILAIIITKGFYIKSLKGHFKFIKRMYKSVIDPKKRGEVRAKIPNPITMFFNVPYLIFLPIFFIGTFSIDIKYQFICIWGLCVTCIALFWFLGEGYRHIYLAVVPYAVYISLWENSYKLEILGFFIVISVIFILLKLYRTEKADKLHMTISEDFIKCCKYIAKNKNPEDIILCLPLICTYQAAYFTNGIMLQGSGGEGKGLEFNLYLHNKVNNNEIQDIINKYNPTWVLNKSNQYLTTNIVLTSGNIKVYKVENN